MPYSYRVNQEPGGGVTEIGLAVPESEFLNRGILTSAESAECIGGQLGRLGDLPGSLRAALFVDHLTKNYPQVFANIPRWQQQRVPADLATIVVQGLNKVSEDGSSYFYRGIDEVQQALENYPWCNVFSRAGRVQKKAAPTEKNEKVRFKNGQTS